MRRKTSGTLSSASLGFERGLRLGRDRRERGRVAHCEVGEHLAVELDFGLVAAGYELVVGKALLPRCGVDADDPEAAEDALLLLAVAVRVDIGVEDRLLRLAVGDVGL